MADSIYLSETDRIIEESYACKLLDKEIRLTFTEGDYSYTDGHLIVVNPLLDDMYRDYEAIRKTERELKIDDFFSRSEENTVRLITRLQVIQEALRIKYTAIPTHVVGDEDASDEKRRTVLEIINQIVDDAYMENVGAGLSDVMRQYLRFYRLLLKNHNDLGNLVIRDFRTHIEYEDEQTDVWLKKDALNTYLEYMAIYTLYPMIHEDVPVRIGDYVEKTKDLFLRGSVCYDPKNRYAIVKEIYAEIEELLRELPKEASAGGGAGNSSRKPENERKTSTINPNNGKNETQEKLGRILGKSKTHSEAGMADPDRKNKPQNGKAKNSLFGRYEEMGDGSEIYHNQNLISEDIYDIPVIRNGSHEKVRPYTLGCSKIHDRMTLHVLRPSRGIARMGEYNTIKSKYKALINTYRSKISEYLKAEDNDVEDRCLFGNRIDSKHLIDKNRRFWRKESRMETMPKLGVLFMVDCSYSMAGARIQAVRQAMVIMNEVLFGQDIEYAVFGHTAIHREPEVVHQICLDFGAKSIDHYNLMELKAQDGSREGISLLWADDYLKKRCPDRERIIIAISDGEPIHFAGAYESYSPPESVEDAAKCVNTIMRSGTKVIAIALEGSGDPCYDKLARIYPSVIECNSMSYLPKQVLELLAREIKERRRPSYT